MSKSLLMPSYRRVLELLEQRNETRAEFESALGIGNPYLLALAAPRYVAVLRALDCAIEGVEDWMLLPSLLKCAQLDVCKKIKRRVKIHAAFLIGESLFAFGFGLALFEASQNVGAVCARVDLLIYPENGAVAADQN